MIRSARPSRYSEIIPIKATHTNNDRIVMPSMRHSAKCYAKDLIFYAMHIDWDLVRVIDGGLEMPGNCAPVVERETAETQRL